MSAAELGAYCFMAVAGAGAALLLIFVVVLLILGWIRPDERTNETPNQP